MRAKSLAFFAALAGLALVATQDSASACCKPKFERSKPHVNVGTIGHAQSSGRNSRRSGATSNANGNNALGAKPRKRQQQELLIFVTPYLTTPTN